MQPRPEQLAAAKAVAKHHRGIISAATGSGKSLMIGLVINELQVRTLVVTPSVELKHQLGESLSKLFGADKVGKNRDIYVENVQALNPNIPATDYDCVIIDEFHHGASSTYRKLNQKAWKGIYYRVGLTATPWRTDAEEKLLLEGLLSTIIYELSYQDAVAQGYIVPVEAYVVDVPTQETDAHTYAQVYNKLIVNNKARNELMALILLRLNAAFCSTLCLVKEIEHGSILEELTNVPFANGKDADSRVHIKDFAQARLTSMIGTTGIVGEGVDTLPCEYVIIGGLGKAKSAFLQQVGRGVRRYGNKESCKVIIFKDASHKFTLRHYREQVKILKEYYGCTPVKLEV